MAETRPKRPTRACTSRMPPLPAPPTIPQKKQAEPPPPLVFINPAETEQDRLELRAMWELASVINFINAFRPLLNVKEFSNEELETALLTCNHLLSDIHIALLKGIHPPNRTPLSRETWITVLYKKLRSPWKKVAEPPFPLAGCHGDEVEVYRGLRPATKLVILRALCELRLDQEDVRVYMEPALKKGYISSFRKERSAANPQGELYWCENDTISGYRLYREIPQPKSKEFRGRNASPPRPSQWETLASNLDEFQSVAETLLSSRSKQELGLGKKLKLEVIPVLEEIQKKKERALKRQQRQANLLNSTFQANGLASGRAKRDRKPVTYTFDEYDRSIKEAIKWTRKKTQSPDANGHANGHAENSRKDRSSHKERLDEQPDGDDEERDQRPDDDEKDQSDEQKLSNSRQEDGVELSVSTEHEFSNDVGTPQKSPVRSDREFSSDDGTTQQESRLRSRERRRSQRYNHYEYIDSGYYDEDDIYSDDDIEGEAIYDDDFVRERKRKKGGYSTDEEYREEDEDNNVDDEDNLDGSYSEDEHKRKLPKLRFHRLPRRKARKSKPVTELRKSKPVRELGLRRSQRATRSKVRYEEYEESEMEDEEQEEERDVGEKSGSWGVEEDEKASVSSVEEGDSMGSSENLEQPDKQKTIGLNHVNGGLQRKELFLDLNESAPLDSPRDLMDDSDAAAG